VIINYTEVILNNCEKPFLLKHGFSARTVLEYSKKEEENKASKLSQPPQKPKFSNPKPENQPKPVSAVNRLP
jgi:hypothetical protein